MVVELDQIVMLDINPFLKLREEDMRGLRESDLFIEELLLGLRVLHDNSLWFELCDEIIS
jgi:hypothetical protein